MKMTVHIQQTVELLPCPFCGSQSLQMTDSRIRCKNCGALGPQVVGAGELGVCECWNTREKISENC